MVVGVPAGRNPGLAEAMRKAGAAYERRERQIAEVREGLERFHGVAARFRGG